MLRRPTVIVGVALLAALFVSGCATWFGEAELPEQRAFRLVGIYTYAAIPARNYAALPSASAEVVARVCDLEATVFAGVADTRAALQAGGDTLTAALTGLASALASLNLELFGEFTEDPEAVGIGQRSAVLAAIGLQSAAEMRAWRLGYLNPKLADMAAAQRPPAPAEWEELDGAAGAAHAALRERCPSPPV